MAEQGWGEGRVWGVRSRGPRPLSSGLPLSPCCWPVRGTPELPGQGALPLKGVGILATHSPMHPLPAGGGQGHSRKSAGEGGGQTGPQGVGKAKVAFSPTAQSLIPSPLPLPACPLRLRRSPGSCGEFRWLQAQDVGRGGTLLLGSPGFSVPPLSLRSPRCNRETALAPCSPGLIKDRTG